jgi:SagB-type dehydrogenase family enzyme
MAEPDDRTPELAGWPDPASRPAREAARRLHAWLDAQIELAPEPRSEDRNDRDDPPAPSTGSPPVVLPAPGPDPVMGLGPALRTRRSHYRWAPRSLTLAELGDLLAHAVGVGRRVAAHGRADHPLGLAPSGGGLNPVRVHVASASVAGLAAGVHRYQPEGHLLLAVRDGDPSAALLDCYLQPEFARRAPVTLVLSVATTEAFARYPLRHYRTLLMDAGIATQNLYLVATAQGLGCCAVAGFRDQPVHALIGTPAHELPVLCVALGPALDPAPGVRR